MSRNAGGVVALLLVVVGAPAADAQQGIPFSQHGTVSQRVGYTDIAISYNRPVARGRTLFGGVVRWGRIWNPGADSATTIELSRDVEIEGQPLAAGSYTLWMMPQPAPEPWTVIFSKAVHVFHTPYPGERHDALRLTVMPEAGAHMEVLAFYLPVVAPDSAVLRMHWGTTIVPLRIHVHNN
ncbi:MAG: DUF2911 domain-containing protein [Gemmatimonadetes bacterium]|nr:DUF2911 domain-containing protein [Gemmatimonadota bacterium]MBI2536658.1 DUF2911 domain-containing protein [Gemmatimonadota bacterium]